MAIPLMRRWIDPRDDELWEVVYAPGVEEDPPTVRHAREGLIFRGRAGRFHAPAIYGSDLGDLTDADLRGLLDQAREEKARVHAHAGWGAGSESED